MTLVGQRGVYIYAVGKHIWYTAPDIDDLAFWGVPCASVSVTCHDTGYMAIAPQFIGYVNATLVYGLVIRASPGVHHQTDIIPSRIEKVIKKYQWDK